MNPLLSSQYYIPDVEARVDQDGTIYLYGSKDIVNDDDYCSNEYQVFYSKDMVHWEAGAISFSTEQMQEKTDIRLYAPDCIKKDGKYYLLYCLADGAEGIAESESPLGPFTDRGIIKEAHGIDPSALVEKDKVYYFWGQMGLHGAELDLETGKIREETHKTNLLTQDEDGFHEGSSIRKINGKYYMVYADISRGRPTCLGYAISDNPLGPYEKKGIIIDNNGCDPSSWNDHGSIQKIGEDYYVFYHRSTHNSVYSRRVCAEKIQINEDGTIDEVEMTTQGAESHIPDTRVLTASAFCKINGKAYLENYTSATESYEFLTNIHNGDGAYIKYYLFEGKIDKIQVKASNTGLDSQILVHMDGPDGEVVAEIQIGKSKGNYDFAEYEAPLKRSMEGRHSVYFEFAGSSGKLMNVKEFCFK